MVSLGVGARGGGRIRSLTLDMLTVRFCIRNQVEMPSWQLNVGVQNLEEWPGLESYMWKLLA